MANSTTNLDLISESQSSKEVTANNLFDAGSYAMLYGRRASTTAGLTWGYYGGNTLIAGGVTAISNGTIALTPSATNYVQADPSTGIVSTNTTEFTEGFTPLYEVVAGASAVTSYTDMRVGGAGAPGIGLPSGGFTNEILRKASNTDFDFEWASPGSGDVVGPASSTDGNLALFDGATGRLLKDSGVAAPTGTNTGDQTITLTGDVTGSGTGSFAATLANSGATAGSYGDGTHVAAVTVDAKGRITAIADVAITGAAPSGSAGGDLAGTYPNPTIGTNKVTLGQMAQVATARILGRTTASTGDVEALTGTQATALLDAFVGDSGSGGTKGLVPAPASGDAAAGKFLKADGTYAVPPGAGGGGSVTNTGGALTSNAVVLGAGTDDTKVVAGITTDGTSALNLGVAGASVGKVVLANATSGSITVQPATGALGTVTLTAPAANGTLALLSQITGTNSGTNTGDETATTLGATVHAATAKTTPVDADEVPLVDSAASNILKRVTWANIKATLKTYFDTLYAAFGETVNAQTGTSYTYLNGDAGKLVTHTNAASIAGTLPQAGSGGNFAAGWWMDVQNRGAGTLTVTPTTSTIDGAASLAISSGQGARIVSDGTNYFTARGGAGASAGGGSSIVGTAGAQGGNATATGGASSTSANAGGAVVVTGGAPGATGIGGAVTLVGSNGGSTSGAGGPITATGGTGGATGTSNGGAITLTGGTAGAGSGVAAGGAINLVGGAAGATAGSAGGAVSITAGNGNGNSGAITMQAGSAGAVGFGNGNVGGAITETAGQGGTATSGWAGGVGGAVTLTAGVGGTTSGAGTPGAGGDVNLNAGAAGTGGTGNANGGNVVFKGGAGSGTGGRGNVVLNGSGSALSTSAVGGFMCIPTCAGTPTGTPANVPTGCVAMVYDTTNDYLYVYRGGWKKTTVFA